MINAFSKMTLDTFDEINEFSRSVKYADIELDEIRKETQYVFNNKPEICGGAIFSEEGKKILSKEPEILYMTKLTIDRLV